MSITEDWIQRIVGGGDFLVRFPNGMTEVAHIEECTVIEGECTVIRGHVSMRNFAYPPDAPEIAVKDDRGEKI